MEKEKFFEAEIEIIHTGEEIVLITSNPNKLTLADDELE